MYKLVNWFVPEMNFPLTTLYRTASTDEEKAVKYLPALTS